MQQRRRGCQTSRISQMEMEKCNGPHGEVRLDRGCGIVGIQEVIPKADRSMLP